MFTEIRNIVDFNIRNLTKFFRKNYEEKSDFALERNDKENLYTYDILKRFFLKTSKTPLRILDIGSKNWFYAIGEYRFFDEFCKDFILDGVEIDAYRLYSNFYSRFEVAKYHTKNFKNTNYIVDNLLNITNKYDYIIWFLPFVAEKIFFRNHCYFLFY